MSKHDDRMSELAEASAAEYAEQCKAESRMTFLRYVGVVVMGLVGFYLTSWGCVLIRLWIGVE